MGSAIVRMNIVFIFAARLRQKQGSTLIGRLRIKIGQMSFKE